MVKCVVFMCLQGDRTEALLFLVVQNLVDEKYKLEVFFVICYENFRRQLCYSTFILG